MSEIERPFVTNSKIIDGMTVVACPICKFEYCNVVRAYVTQSAKATVVSRHETLVRHHDDIHPRGAGRGSTVTLCMQCENHHVFEVDFRFHKGMTEIVTVEGDKEDFIDSDDEKLWRD